MDSPAGAESFWPSRPRVRLPGSSLGPPVPVSLRPDDQPPAPSLRYGPRPQFGTLRTTLALPRLRPQPFLSVGECARLGNRIISGSVPVELASHTAPSVLDLKYNQINGEARGAEGELANPAANDVAEQPDKLVVGDVVNFLYVRKNKVTKVLYSSSAVVVTAVCSPHHSLCWFQTLTSCAGFPGGWCACSLEHTHWGLRAEASGHGSGSV